MSADEAALRRYLEATNAMGPDWSPDGRSLTFIWNETGSYQVYLAHPPDAGGGRPRVRQVTSGSDRCTDPRFLPDGAILFTSDVGGNENFQLFLADVGHDGADVGPDGAAATGEDADNAEGARRIRRLTTADGAKHRVVSVGEREMLFVANDLDRSRFTLYRHALPIDTWRPEALFTPERGVIQQARRLPDYSILLELAYSNMHQELLLLTDDGAPTPRSLTTAVAGNGDIRWTFIRAVDTSPHTATQSADPEPAPLRRPIRLLAATDLDSDRFRPVLLELDGAVHTIPAIEDMPAGELGDTSYRPGRPETFLEFNIEGYSRLYRFHQSDAAGSASQAWLEEITPPFAGAVVSGDARTSRLGLSLAPTSDHPRTDRLAVAFGGPAQVANVWIADAGTHGWQRISGATVPGVAEERLATCKLTRFNSFDGLSVPFFTYRPAGDGPFPTVLMIHGGPEAQARPSFNSVIQFLVAAGFAVVVPNIRGSAGYGRRYLDLDNREKRLDSIRDIAELAHRLAESEASVDGDRLAVMGGSYGGFAVLSALTEYPEIWKAGVDIVGISNFVTFLENTAAWRRSLRESEYGSLAERELLERISPINRIERVTAPLLIIQGDNDERVPLSESQQMYDRLHRLGRTVELMRFSDEGHGITKLDNRIRAYTRVAQWLRTHM